MKKLLTLWVALVAALMSFHQAEGQVLVSGTVYEQDSISPISGAMVMFSAIDTTGETFVYQFITDSLGHYEDSINYGMYKVSACAEGYECSYLQDSLLIAYDSLSFEYDSLVVVYDSLTGIYDSIYMVYDSLTGQYDTLYFDTETVISGINLVLYEIRYPVRYVAASPYAGDLVRISWSMYDSLRYEEREESIRSFRYFELFRRRIDGQPVFMASLTDTVFVDAYWSSLPWGQYCWGVSCCYEGNRYASDTIWSAFLDKDMTTALEVNITTNVGLPAADAVVTLVSHEGQGHTYQGVADADGHLLMDSVYRGSYDIHVHLDGFMDYVSSEPLSVMEPQQTQIELMEALYAVDSLYVSFTGYAIWHLSDAPRDLQYYELRLNGQMVGNTTDTSFQFDISGLSPGQTYRAEVRPVFLSETCSWHVLDWVFWPCSHFQGSENGLQWSLTEEAVQLSWDNPEGATILGAFLFRDGEYLGFIEGNSFLDETVVMHGEVSYCMHLLYGGPTDGTYYSESCEECVVVSFPNYCDPPMKLEGENYWNSDLDYGALISWGERPEPIYQWLYYDDGVYKRSLGGDNEPIIFWSIRFESADLEPYAGSSLKKISLFDVGAGEYSLFIYVGGETAPGSLAWMQNMTLCNTHAWHEEVLSQPIVIPENEPLWIVVGQQGLSRPAAACADMGNPNGRWVSLDGEHWTDLVNYNMHYTWMLRAYVTNRSGRIQPLDEGSYALQHYNLYRSYDNANYQQIAMIPAVEGQAFYQYRDVLIDNGHDAFYYRLSALYQSDDGETCESDFAFSLYDPDEQYVYVDDHWSTGEREEVALKLYPNPANDIMHVEMTGMQHVAICNVMGQIVLEKEANESLQLDLSNLPEGMYWLRAMSQNGVTVKPFVLAR